MGWFALVCPACLGGTSLGYLLAHFRSEQLPDEFDVPCAIVEVGGLRLHGPIRPGHWDKGPREPSSLRAARTCSCAFCCLFLYVDFVLGVVSHSSKRVSYILCMLKAADPSPLGKQTQLLLHLPFQTEEPCWES